MLSKHRLWISLILSIMSGAVTITSAGAFPDSPPPQFNFVDSSSTSSFGSVGSSTGSESFTGGVAIPTEMSSPTGATDGSGISGDGTGISGDGSGISGDGTGVAGEGSGSNGEGSNGTGTITVADIADYYAKNIDSFLNDLANEDVAQKPRRIVRRRSTACPNPQISSSSEKLDELLNQSEQFIKQVNQIEPEKRIW